MSPDESKNDSEPDPPSSTSTAESDEEIVGEIRALLKELRAEVTRLKAHRAKEQTENWIQRHPMLAVSVSAVLGGAAGYGTALARRPRPPNLSEQAQRGLGRLAGEIRRVASDVGRTVTNRAAQSGQEAREQLQESGRQLAQGAREAPAVEALQQALEEAPSEEVREIGKSLEKMAEETLGEQAESVQRAVSEIDDRPTLKRALWSIVGLAAGSFVAAQVRRWL
ncbi:MAG: hypothetical protein ABEL04_10580 [Salinibacter sp.]|uniref:hypothetical protein n=1 Tax=Salinibacter sp. TaxID=2065818 RepID=UPI0035D47947